MLEARIVKFFKLKKFIILYNIYNVKSMDMLRIDPEKKKDGLPIRQFDCLFFRYSFRALSNPF